MLLVVVPRTMPLEAREVDRWIELLKIQRERRRETAQSLPILRLSPSQPSHRPILAALKLDDRSEIRTYTCVRDVKGWPTRVLLAHEPNEPADIVIAATLAPASEPTTNENEQSVGLLLVSDSKTRAATEPFLQELGRFWLSRYGRVRPSPYPLASYDLDDPAVVAALETAFPSLVSGPSPVLALCVFSKDQPVEILKLFRDFDTPASLVRELSSVRGAALPSVVASRPGVGSAPKARPLGVVSDEQERLLLVSRLQETARQLWTVAKDDDSRRNQSSKKLILRIIEESRSYLANEPGAWGLLRESLQDYAVEPFESDDARLTEGLVRFLHLGKTLLVEP